MEPIELVAALLSFVYALALTHILQSATELWLARERLRFSLALAAWMVLSVLMLVANWLALIPLAKSEWSHQIVMLSFFTGIVQYFTCSLVSPKAPERGRVDMRAHEDRSDVGYLTAYLLLCVCAIAGNGLQFEEWAGVPFNWPMFIDASLFVLGFAVCVTICIFRKERWLQVGVPTVYSLYMLKVLILG